MDSRCPTNVLVGFAAMVVASGCAGHSERTGGAAREDLARAEASIAAAEKVGAYEHASADLNRARGKLNAARTASVEGDEGVARRLAIEADLDADVAAATASNREVQAAVAELQESIRTLRDELRRNEQRSLGRL